MTHEEFIKKVANYCGTDEAKQIANDYTDEEICEHGEEILQDLDEEYRYCANVEHYQEHGY